MKIYDAKFVLIMDGLNQDELFFYCDGERKWKGVKKEMAFNYVSFISV